MASLGNGSPGPLGDANRRLVRTIDGLSDEDWSAPSLLPGWTRSHVVAHLALNAEGLAGAVTGVVEGRPVTMYASDRARDEDIATLATAGPSELRDRLFGAATRLADALAALGAGPPELSSTLIDRAPDSPRRFPAADVAHKRWCEVEIHHADLDCGYGPGDWPREFAQILLDDAVERHRSGPQATLVATDMEASWRLGSDTGGGSGSGTGSGPTVRGPVHGLAWWLTGRAPVPGAEVTSDDGELPRIEGW